MKPSKPELEPREREFLTTLAEKCYVGRPKAVKLPELKDLLYESQIKGLDGYESEIDEPE